MRLQYVCDFCGQQLVLFKGRPSSVPQGTTLIRRISEVHDKHVHECKGAKP